ncbi:7588_t:CDS:2 [Cetraspora pellucida]|uniref:7588_t:CDS:1 n=1 Tax=Cetraspora pellucida TaxID=1433469 RepID=A0ACA9LBI6_9GLOM|nr:7588_t:CDS:2 [Cetraspora pellucida]
MDHKNKSLSQHVELTNTASFKNDESTAVKSINKNQPTVSKSVCLSNKTLHSSTGNNNAISSLNAQLGTETVDLHLNTTKQYLYLVKNQWFTKMYVSQLLSESLGHSKTIYFDGHEHEDMVKYRNYFLQKMDELRFQMVTYKNENLERTILPRLPYGVREIVLVTHNETLFYANDDMHKVWGSKDESMLHNKSQGLSMHVIEAAGHMCIFYPKFYCELNYIEFFWAEAKRVARLNCNYTFRSLKRAVLRALNSVNIIKIHHFAHHSERFMSAYKLGLSGKAAAFMVKKYYSHHQIPEKVLKEFAHN